MLRCFVYLMCVHSHVGDDNFCPRKNYWIDCNVARARTGNYKPHFHTQFFVHLRHFEAHVYTMSEIIVLHGTWDCVSVKWMKLKWTLIERHHLVHTALARIAVIVGHRILSMHCIFTHWVFDTIHVISSGMKILHWFRLILSNFPR